MTQPRARAVVDLSAVTSSTAHLVRAASSAEVMAVVKADGYGHGLVPCAQAALAGGATWLGTAFAEEALALRDAGVTAPILSWLATPGEDLGIPIGRDIDVSASAPWAVEQVVAGAERAGRTARLHLKVDTGLSRAGARLAQDWDELCRSAAKAAAQGGVEIVGVWSHLVHGAEPHHPTTEAQREAFIAAIEMAGHHGIKPQVRHLASSGATLGRPDMHFDLVRPGIAVYGLSPSGLPVEGLRPAMRLLADVALTKRVPAGTGVSYGHDHVTSAEVGLAVVPLGYADGLPRAGGGAVSVQLGGRRRQVAGRVCMDQFVVETGDDLVTAGDTVVLFGPGDDGEPTADDWARWLGTINYEVVTGIGPRVPRIYLGQS